MSCPKTLPFKKKPRGSIVTRTWALQNTSLTSYHWEMQDQEKTWCYCDEMLIQWCLMPFATLFHLYCCVHCNCSCFPRATWAQLWWSKTDFKNRSKVGRPPSFTLYLIFKLSFLQATNTWTKLEITECHLHNNSHTCKCYDINSNAFYHPLCLLLTTVGALRCTCILLKTS